MGVLVDVCTYACSLTISCQNNPGNSFGCLQVVIGRNNKQNDELSMRLANSVLRALCLRIVANAWLLHHPHIAMCAVAA